MFFELSDLIVALPEIVILFGASLVMLIDLYTKKDPRNDWAWFFTLLTLFAAISVHLLNVSPERDIVFSANYVRDPMSDGLKLALLIIALPVFIYAREGLLKQGHWRGEYLMLALFSVLGMMVMISANGFIALYLGLELLALSMYALVAFDRNSLSGGEAAMKYFVLGALASGLLLYGISMIYGATGKIDFQSVNQALQAGTDKELVLVFGLVFVIIGIAFKFGAVPFHMWVPDVYDGAPTAVVTLLGSLPKIAAVAMAMRILVDALGQLHEHWSMMLMILAVISLILGNLVAIAQQNIKRMLAYSTIAHVGFIFLGILSGTSKGYVAAQVYAIVYAAMAAGAFGLLIALDKREVPCQDLDQLKGLNDKHPWLAGTMFLLMFSMAGVPPTVGFWVKLYVLDAVVSVGMTWLAVVAVFFSIIGAFYYIRIVKLMYFDKPLDEEAIEVSPITQSVLAINGLAMLFFGLFPALLGVFI